mmetsp:Transcript_52632/g.94478  ORF Transcript_52632/g.94478 Transcript_52632/m.94478 type:complete len:153 (+) Transcript_52632:49-507(+)
MARACRSAWALALVALAWLRNFESYRTAFVNGRQASACLVRRGLLIAAAAEGQDDPPRNYFQEMRATPAGNKFWARRTEEAWGEKASGDAGCFDKDDLVEAVYSGDGEWYCAQVMKYVGNSDWIVLWHDDMPDENLKASVVSTKDMKHISLR